MATMQTSAQDDDDQLLDLWNNACSDYAAATGISISDKAFPKLGDPKQLLSELEREESYFKDFRNKKRALFRSVQNVLAPIEVIGDLVGAILSPTFPPAPSIMGAVLLLVRAGRGVSAAFDAIIDLFDEIKVFTLRLEMYKNVPLSRGMQEIVIRVLAEVLAICALSRKLVSQGRLINWAKSALSNDKKVQAALQTLRDLTNKEHMMSSAQTMARVHEVYKEGHETRSDVAEIKRLVQTEQLKQSQLNEKGEERAQLVRIREALQPVMGSDRVYHDTRNSRMHASCEWLWDNEAFEIWSMGDAPLLWIHGSPGAGKSHLASKIVSDLLGNPRLGIFKPENAVAYFFFKENDESLRSLNHLLRTIVWQIASKDAALASKVDHICLIGDLGNNTLWNLIADHFRDDSHERRACLLVDALDEAYTKDRDELLSILEETFVNSVGQVPRISFAFTSRDNQRQSLKEHSLDDVLQVTISSDSNREDIMAFISMKLSKAPVYRNIPKLRVEVMRSVFDKADGLWMWASLALETLLKLRTKSAIRKALEEMPLGLPKMFRHELERLSQELETSPQLVEHLNIILAWLACAERPLKITELETILEVTCGERVYGLADELKNTYSSLLKITPLEPIAEDSDDEDSSSDGCADASSNTGSVNRESRDKDVIYDEDSDQKDDDESDTDGSATDIPHESDYQVSFHHASFAEYFLASSKDTAIGVDIERARVQALRQTLFAFLNKKRFPSLREYASQYLLYHLAIAEPSLESPDDVKSVSSSLLKMFTSEDTIFDWALIEVDVMPFEGAPSERGEITETLNYWLRCEDSSTSKHRADQVLRWLYAAKDIDCLHVSHRAWLLEPGKTGVKKLLGPIAQICTTQWLSGESIDNIDEPLTQSLSEIVLCYHYLIDDSGHVVSRNLKPQARDIVSLAKSTDFSETPVWHAKVALALTPFNLYEDAIEHFRIALDSTGQSWKCHEWISRAYGTKGDFRSALYHIEQVRTLRAQDAENSDQYEDGGTTLGLPSNMLMNIAHWQESSGQIDEAIDTAKLALNARHKWIHFTLLFCLRLFTKYRRAQELIYLLSHYRRIKLKFFDMHVVYNHEAFYVMYQVTRHKNASEFNWTKLWALAEDVAELHGSAGYEKYSPSFGFTVGLIRFENARVGEANRIWSEGLNELESSLARTDPRAEEANEKLGDANTTWSESCCSEPGSSLTTTDPQLEEAATRIKIMIARLHFDNVLEVTPELCSSEESLRLLRRMARESEAASKIDRGGIAKQLLANWYRLQGQNSEAKLLLRTSVKNSLMVLSDDDPSNDIDGYEGLLMVFLVMRDHEDDLAATLHLVKYWHGLFEPGNCDESEPAKAQRAQEGDFVTECQGCHIVQRTWTHWNLCRFCPGVGYCGECFQKLRDGTLGKRACLPKHEFFDTGPPLKEEDRIPKGKVKVRDELIWIEEWKERLATEWELDLDEINEEMKQTKIE